MRSRKRERGKMEETFFHKSLVSKKDRRNESWWRKEGDGEKEKRWTKKEDQEKKKEIKKKKGIERQKSQKWRKRWKNR